MVVLSVKEDTISSAKGRMHAADAKIMMTWDTAWKIRSSRVFIFISLPCQNSAFSGFSLRTTRFEINTKTKPTTDW